MLSVLSMHSSGYHFQVFLSDSASYMLQAAAALKLRKSYSTPVFPPKRVRSCQTKVLERRRQSLEHYLQVMLRFGPSRDQVLAFLGISKPRPTEVSVEATSEVKSLDHQPIYKYDKDPYIDSERKSALPDVVTQGVLMALYGKTQ
ncbi:sorting nexin-24 isoform X2 [Anabrus simplex]|uniref:sorting nexin-24 isoform X2 n=1 Tax=Anabrus simplex TaxID=316456 RepID=UPI0034DD794E